MNNHVEEVNVILEISGTILEGLNHIVTSVKEGKENPPFYLLEDVVEGYFSVRRVLGTFSEKLPENHLLETGEELENELGAVFIALEAKDEKIAAQLVELFVIPAAEKWKVEIEENLNKFSKS